MTGRRPPRPRKAIIYYRGLPHLLNLALCHQAFVRRQVDGKFDSMGGLATAARCSRSTASRFFAGRVNNLQTTLRILEQLGLGFDEVAIPCGTDEGDDAT